PDEEHRGRVMSAKVKRTALVDGGHDPEIVRKVTVADLSADPDSQLLEQVRAKLLLHRDQRLVWPRPHDRIRMISCPSGRLSSRIFSIVKTSRASPRSACRRSRRHRRMPRSQPKSIPRAKSDPVTKILSNSGPRREFKSTSTSIFLS